jgi:hypothetical protein
LSQIAKQFDINQVFYMINLLGPSTYLWQQAFNIRIQESGLEDGDLHSSLLPKTTFGLQIPQELTENERAAMKNAVNTFMAARFNVRLGYHDWYYNFRTL